MKAITLIIAMITVLVFNTNAQNTDVKELLDNKETRTELFNAIASDHQMMMDFIKVAKKNEHGAMMMRDAENPEMKKMGSMQGGNDEQKMMGMMKNNPEMMQKMMGNMMEMCKKDSAMRNKMANMMSENPEMMKMCMQKMKEKGMMNSDGKMMDSDRQMMNSDGKMMDKKGKSNQENHNH
ncbi:hypothetical protein [Marinilabilia salmonicolor]|uniref:Uncharacterized protein n=1 Tax=Marinilabilia salmonicolor TaxID=989 RepID=A0A368VD24_9BACT|nr:hypothetical protein [Marinilabilia salmonicolor]RCW39089.1 hypothetical protein DFO77_102244 [Marinilabilia salmonicolor]